MFASPGAARNADQEAICASVTDSRPAQPLARAGAAPARRHYQRRYAPNGCSNTRLGGRGGWRLAYGSRSGAHVRAVPRGPVEHPRPTLPTMAPHSPDPLSLPPSLPAPADDGAASHLVGLRVPPIALLATDGRMVRLDRLDATPRTVLYAYPRTGRPGEPNPADDWDLIPGARGCTPQACDFRDHHADLLGHGAAVLGISTQSSAYQREAAERLHLPFPLLSDQRLELARAMRLPTFDAGGQTLLKRVTLILRERRVEHCFYPVFPPDRHADEVLAWLAGNRL